MIDIHTHQHSGNGYAIRNLIATNEAERILLGTTKFCSIGVHPWVLSQFFSGDALAWLEDSADLPNVLAIGETGLDKMTDAPLAFQTEIFREHIRIAESVKKPMILHCVRAFSEILAIRRKEKAEMPWILHGFAKKIALAEELRAEGFLFSFGVEILRKDSTAARTLAEISAESLFLESDTSEISIEKIYEKAAEIRGISTEEMTETIWKNARKIFPTLQ